MIGASTNPTAFPNVYFQCDGSGNPLPSNPDGSQAQGTPCNKIPSRPDQQHWTGHDEHVPRAEREQPQRGLQLSSIEPVRQLDETKFDVRLDQTLSTSDNLFGRFSYDQAFSYVPGGAPGICRSQRLRQQSAHSATTRATSPSARRTCSPPRWSTRPALVTTASSTTSLRKARGPAPPPPSCPVAFLAPTWDAPPAACLPGAYSCGLVSTISRPAAIGPSVIAATLRSRAEPTSSLSETPSSSFGTSMTSKWESIFARNQMNVGTEAFQDGFWIIGNGGNFTGLRQRRTFPAIRRRISCSASRAWPFTTRHSMAPSPAADGRSIAPSSRTIGGSPPP